MQLSKEHKNHVKTFENERKATVKRWLSGMSSPAVMKIHKALREVIKWEMRKYEADGRLWLATDLPQVVKYMQDVTYRNGE